jgi:hypothetical protein
MQPSRNLHLIKALVKLCECGLLAGLGLVVAFLVADGLSGWFVLIGITLFVISTIGGIWSFRQQELLEVQDQIRKIPK